MTLKSMMTADAAAGTGVFLPVDADGAATDFNELVCFYPAGDARRRTQVNVIWVFDDEIGTNEAWGDGVTLNERNGRKLRQSATVECGTSIAVRDEQPRHNFDVFEKGGEFFAVKRIIGRDNDMMSVRVVRTVPISIQGQQRSG